MTIAPHGLCLSCETPLLQPYGFHSTDLCGPCCTGEAATYGQVSVQCPKCSTADMSLGDEIPAGDPIPVCHKCRGPMILTPRDPRSGPP